MREPTLTLSGLGAPRVYRIVRSPFVVGRDASTDLQIDHGWVSRKQLVLERDGSAWQVRPEGKNPMTLNDVPLSGVRALEPGDRIGMGPAHLTFDLQEVVVELDDEEIGPATLEIPLDDLRRDRIDPLSALGEASVELVRARDAASAAAAAARWLHLVTGARSVAVVRTASATPQVIAEEGERIERLSRRLITRATSGRAVVALDDASRVPGLADRASITMSRVGPVLVAPLGPGLEGVLYADRALGSPPFERKEATFAAVLAHLAGAALKSAERVEADTERRHSLELERGELLRDIERRGRFGELIGSSPPMAKLAAAIAKVAPTDATVLILGETGSGKELVAREVHRRSRRGEGPFFALNCAALPDTLLESELFGHRRGAFTGADRDRKGIFELAKGGSVFLDEIGELPAAAQAKILRVLDAREILPLGGGHPQPVDVRVIAATHRDLAGEVQAGRFRQDLLYRLRVFPLQVPPLRERREDLPALVAHFLETIPEARKKRLLPPTARTLERIAEHEFPGNVRELAHLMEQAVIFAEEGETLDLSHFSDEIGRHPAPRERPSSPATPDANGLPYPGGSVLRDMVGAVEREIIIRELGKDGWNRTRTARRLKVSLRAFMDKLKRYDISEP